MYFLLKTGDIYMQLFVIKQQQQKHTKTKWHVFYIYTFFEFITNGHLFLTFL